MVHTNFQRAALAAALALAIGAACGSALVAAPQGNDPPGADDQQTPPANSGESLSDQLDRNKGVINPPPTGDTDIETTVPQIPGP